MHSRRKPPCSPPRSLADTSRQTQARLGKVGNKVNNTKQDKQRLESILHRAFPPRALTRKKGGAPLKSPCIHIRTRHTSSTSTAQLECEALAQRRKRQGNACDGRD